MSEPFPDIATVGVQQSPPEQHHRSSNSSADTDDDIDHHLRSELMQNHSRITVENFLAAFQPNIPGGNTSTGCNPPGWEVFLNAVVGDGKIADFVQQYSQATSEEHLYQPFADVANRITSLFKENYGSRVQRQICFMGLGRTYVKGPLSYQYGTSISGSGSVLRPNGLGLLVEENSVVAPEDKDPTLKLNEMETKSVDAPEESRESSCGGFTEPSDGWRRSILAVQHKIFSRTTLSLLKKGPVRLTGYSSPPNPAEGVSTEGRNTNKPNLDGDSEPEANPDGTKVRNIASKIASESSTTTRSESWHDITGSEVQLASCALETLCVLGNRKHTFGILIDGFETSFWYYDRSGAVSSQPFNFSEDIGYLTRFLVAFSCMSLEQLGFNLDIHPPTGVKSGSIAALAPKDLTNYTLDLDEGTVTLKKILDGPRGFIGGGALVYAGVMNEREVVMKLSWQLVQQTPEWHWIKEAVDNGCPQELIVEVRGSQISSKVSSGLRAYFGHAPKNGCFEDRELRVLATEKLGLLMELPVKDFMYAIWCFFLTVELLDNAKIRHCDISVGNLGWTRVDNKLMPKIFDFDHARSIERTRPGSQHLTGTLPFMALDVIREEVLKIQGKQTLNVSHFLRFDLESILWCAVWVTFCFYDGKEVQSTGHPLRDWFSGGHEKIAHAKHAYLFQSFRPSHNWYSATNMGLHRLLRIFAEGYFIQGQKIGDAAFEDKSWSIEETFEGKLDSATLRQILVEENWASAEAEEQVRHLGARRAPST